jgi:membrane-associated phospholipid phosphatase
MRRGEGVATKRGTLGALVLFILVAAVGRGNADGYAIDPLWDGLALGGGLAFAAASEYLVQTAPAPSLAPADISQVNGFDRPALFPFSTGLDQASTILQYATAAVPALFVFVLPWDQIVSVGVIYGEALSWAYFAKNMLKFFLPRYRPFLYSDGGTAPGVASNEYYDSFPSGHATIAFTAATFSVAVFAAFYPDSPYFLPFALMNYGLAALTASFRVLSGMHFMSDVASGALLGVACGYFVPFFHRVKSDTEAAGAVSLVPGAQGLALRIRM